MSKHPVSEVRNCGSIDRAQLKQASSKKNAKTIGAKDIVKAYVFMDRREQRRIKRIGRANAEMLRALGAEIRRPCA